MLLAAAPALRDEGVEMVLVSTGELVGAYAAEFRRSGLRVLHKPFSKSLAFAWQFWRMLRSERPDVMHIHIERANAAIAILGWLAGAPRIVRTVHSVFSYEGRLRQVRSCERGFLRAIGVRHIAIGESVERNELLRLRNPSERVDNWIGCRFVPPTPEQRAAARTELSVVEGEYVVVSVGNCSAVKNHQAILGALPSIAQTTGKPVVYLHAGSGAAEEEEKELATRVGAHPGVDVRFIGPVANVLPLLWASDVYCMPSLYEGLSIAALEAVACGVPVVLSDVPGLRDVYGPSASVRFVEPTAEGLGSGVQALLEAPADSVRRAALEASNAIRASANVVVQVGKLLSIYRKDGLGGR